MLLLYKKPLTVIAFKHTNIILYYQVDSFELTRGQF